MLKSENFRTIYKNTKSLMWLQVITYAISFMAVPFLVRKLGVSGFGIFFLAQSITGYLQYIVEYGFEVSATMEVSENRHDREKLSSIFYSVIKAKLILFSLVAVVFMAILYAVPYFENYRILYFLLLASMGVRAFVPNWFYRGMERMEVTAKYTAFSKVIYLIIILLIVRSDSDYTLAAFALLVSTSYNAFLSTRTALKYFNVSFLRIKGETKNRLKSGFPYFVQSMLDNSAKYFNHVYLSFVAGETAVGIYGGAEKIMDAARSVLSPVLQAILPRSKSIHNESPARWRDFYRKMLLFVIGVSFLLATLLFITSGISTSLILGDAFDSSSALLKIMSVYLFFYGMNHMMGVHVLSVLGKGGVFARLAGISRFSGILFSLSLTSVWGMQGAAFAMLIMEIVFMVLLLYYHITKRPFWGE